MPFDSAITLAATHLANVRKTRTLYVREEDQEVWDKAKEIIGDSLSTYITNHLRTVVESRKAAQQGFERIVVKFTVENIPQAKAFYGRWIIPPSDPYRTSVETLEGEVSVHFAVAVTAKNKVVILDCWAGDQEEEYGNGALLVFDSFEEASNDQWLFRGLICEAMKRQGVQIQELDI